MIDAATTAERRKIVRANTQSSFAPSFQSFWWMRWRRPRDLLVNPDVFPQLQRTRAGLHGSTGTETFDLWWLCFYHSQSSPSDPTPAACAPPLCSTAHSHSGFPEAVTHSSPPSHNHRAGPAVWQDVEKMNLSHQDRGELSLRGGFLSRSPPDRFDESPFPSFRGRKSWGFIQTHRCSIFREGGAPWDVALMRDVTFQPQPRRRLGLTGCRCGSSFRCVDKVNRIQRSQLSHTLDAVVTAEGGYTRLLPTFIW